MNIGPEHVERFSETLENLEADLDKRGEELGERVRGAELVIRILAGVMGLLALANLYFVNDLTEEVKVMIRAMDDMTGHFADVSRRMASMTDTVDAMNDTVRMMPIVAAQIGEISDHVETMRGDVVRMQQITVAVDGRIDTLNGSMLDMAGRFRRVNRSVGAMGQDVEQMARPVP
jgi:methyl-accepting chemotaxis protein